KNGKRTKAEKGMYVGTGVPPYGYRYLLNEKGRAVALAENPVTGAVVRRIFRDVLHVSAHALCRQLDAEGVPTYIQHRERKRCRPCRADRADCRCAAPSFSSGWHPATLHGILNNPVYLGTAVYGRRAGAAKVWQDPSKWVYSPAPALIEQTDWDAARAA